MWTAIILNKNILQLYQNIRKPETISNEAGQIVLQCKLIGRRNEEKKLVVVVKQSWHYIINIWG